jgi:uncharacterized protein YndB with AHSA1/START domain
MITVERSVAIQRPVEEVFAYATSAAKIPEWRPDILATTGPEQVAIGTEFVETINFLGRKPFTMKVRELEQNRKEVIENIAGPGVRPVQTFTFEKIGNATKFTVSVTVRTYGLFRILEPMLPTMIAKNWDGYLRNLKTRLEKH